MKPVMPGIFCPRIVWLTLCGVLAGFNGTSDNYPSPEQMEQWISHEIQRLEDGNKQVFCYSTVNTDVLLERIAGMPQVEELAFEDTDLSETGLRLLKTFPNLKHLSFAGVGCLNEETIGYIEECENLESVTLPNAKLIETLRSRMPNCSFDVHWRSAETSHPAEPASGTL